MVNLKDLMYLLFNLETEKLLNHYQESLLEIVVRRWDKTVLITDSLYSITIESQEKPFLIDSLMLLKRVNLRLQFLILTRDSLFSLEVCHKEDL